MRKQTIRKLKMPLLIFVLFFVMLSLVVSIPPSQSIIELDRVIIGDVTVSDAIIMFSLLAASVDVGTLIFLMQKEKKRKS